MVEIQVGGRSSLHEVYMGVCGGKNMERRFTAIERVTLAYAVGQFWYEFSVENMENARQIGMPINGQAGIGDVEVGGYNNGETFGRVRSKSPIVFPAYFWANVTDPIALTILNQRLDMIQGGNKITLVAPYLGYQRAERPALRAGNIREMPLLEPMIEGLKLQISRLITLDTHSPGTAFNCLKNNIALLDVTVLPILLNFGRKLGLIKDNQVVVNGDDGAYENGRLIQCLLRQNTPLVSGIKTKKDGKTTVVFKEKDLIKFQGKSAIIVEDIIDSGKTMLSTIRQILAAGATEVLVLAKDGIFSPGSEQLAKDPRIHIIVSNSLRPYLPNNIAFAEHAKNIHIVDIMQALKHLVQLDQQGLLKDVHFDSIAQDMLYRETGLMLSPWQIKEFQRN